MGLDDLTYNLIKKLFCSLDVGKWILSLGNDIFTNTDPGLYSQVDKEGYFNKQVAGTNKTI